MAFPVRTIILILTVLSTASFAASCVKVRCPGIMPVVEEDVSGEWVVLSEVYSLHGPGQDEGLRQWNITLQYRAGEGDSPITAAGIRVLFDGDQVLFTFDETDQILETGVSAAFGPSFEHLLTIEPVEGSGFSFPSLNLDFP